MAYIPYGHQEISPEDIKAVTQVLESDFLTQGPVVPQFEAAVAQFCAPGVEAVAVNSATSALHLACLALGVGPGDEVWTTPISFVASANCARYCGASVDFVDVDIMTGNMSTAALEEKLVKARREGRLPKVLVPVHFSGRACDMVKIHELAQEYGFKTIEDASHAIGACYENSKLPVGSGCYSDITVFSFHPVKIITCGEGGMALSRNKQLANRLRRLRTHGIAQLPEEQQIQAEGPWQYQQIEIGFNYRLTDIHAALGLSQTKRLEQFVERRRHIAEVYNELLEPLNIIRPPVSTCSSWHLYPIRVNKQERLSIFNQMREAGIGVQVHYYPVHLQPYYRALGFGVGNFPQAEEFYEGLFSIPLFPGLHLDDQTRVVSTLEGLVGRRPAELP